MVQSFLKGSGQYIIVPLVKRNPNSIFQGIPQSSVLRSVLILTYINDIVSVCPLAHYTLYADDTTILLSDKPTENNCNAFLDILGNWFHSNFLHLNFEEKKCTFSK